MNTSSIICPYLRCPSNPQTLLRRVLNESNAIGSDEKFIEKVLEQARSVRGCCFLTGISLRHNFDPE